MMKEEDFLAMAQGLNTYYSMYEFFLEKTDNNKRESLELLKIWWYGINYGSKKQ